METFASITKYFNQIVLLVKELLLQFINTLIVFYFPLNSSLIAIFDPSKKRVNEF